MLHRARVGPRNPGPSQLYHEEGSRFYGTTKKGKYVSEADAIKEGDRAAAKGQ
jgi:hypothetical protein